MSKAFSNTKLSEETAKGLLRALSTEEVNEVLQSHPAFSDENNWKAYGQAKKNWDRVGGQTSEAVGALAELIINSIDAILMRRAKEEKIDDGDENAPQNMSEAVKRFFPEVLEGRLTLLSNEQRTKLAEKSVQIGIQRKKKRDIFPNYTIIDFGEGQNHKKFEQTFLSLGETNKEGIPFVQGRFNMGSTGSINFCTRSNIRNGMYKLILSKRNLSDSDKLWGWTLIRVRTVQKGQVLPVAEYFCPDGEIACFAADEIRAFNDRKDIGVMKDGGSLVKLYEYDIGPGARTVDFGLYNALTTSLLDCALPLRLYDFDAKPMRSGLRAEGIAARTFSGMKTVLKFDGENDESDDVAFERVIENSENAEVGTIRIFYYGLNNMKEYLQKYPSRGFYTINGQSQSKEGTSLLRKAKLDDLQNHLIVQIDCNEMDGTTRAMVFKSDRERMNDTETTRQLRQIVVDALHDSGELREFARKMRDRRVNEQIEKDETDKDFLAALVKNNPDLGELFGLGDVVYAPTEIPGGVSEYHGNKFPTYLRPKNLEPGNIKSVPINLQRVIECETDAENEYLSRDADQGQFLHPQPAVLPHSASALRNGKFRIRVKAPDNAKVGDEIPVQFGFEDSNPTRTDPLVFNVTVKITAEEQPAVAPPGTPGGVRSHQKPSLNFPEIVLVGKEDWREFNFGEDDGGVVRRGEKFTIYLNRDNKRLLALLAKERDESNRAIIMHRYRYGLGLLTLALYKKMVHEEDEKESESQLNSDLALKLATSAIAPHVVTLIDRLGGNK